MLLNIAPDHLDRHGTMDAYLAAKLRIFANQANEDVAVYNGDDPALAGLDLGGAGGGSGSARRAATTATSPSPAGRSSPAARR